MENAKDDPSAASSASIQYPKPPAHSLTHHSSGLRDEHGHSLTRIQPMSRHSGESVATFFTGLFTTIIGIATLGASITVSFVINNQTPAPLQSSHSFAQMTVHTFLSISWLLFILALAFASLGSTLLTFFREHWKADWDGRNGVASRTSVQVYASVTISTLGGLVIAAFIMLCLVVTAYSPVVGWIAVGFTAVFGLVILLSVCYQAPWWWRDNPPIPSKVTTA